MQRGTIGVKLLLALRWFAVQTVAGARRFCSGSCQSYLFGNSSEPASETMRIMEAKRILATANQSSHARARLLVTQYAEPAVAHLAKQSAVTSSHCHSLDAWHRVVTSSSCQMAGWWEAVAAHAIPGIFARGQFNFVNVGDP